MMHKLKKQFHAAMFGYSYLGLLLNPFFIARRGLLNAIRQLAHQLSANKLLDIGCGDKPYEMLFKVQTYHGLELERAEAHRSKADFYYDGRHMPFEAASYDAVLCNQVLEHVFNPDDFLQEIHRVLTPQGKLLLTVPFCWDEHEQPYDYARYSSFGLQYLLEKHGFIVMRHHKSVKSVAAIFQMYSAYWFKVFSPKHKITLLLVALWCFPINFIGILLGALLPENPDFYLDNVVLAQKVSG
jgi:SAM-dependent methyltransferase